MINIMRVGNLEELKPVPATNEGTYHQVEAGYHHRRPGLLADQRRAENGDCDNAGACGPECDEDEWRSLVMEDRTVDGGGCKSRKDACTILLGVFCAFSFAAAFYALGGTRGAVEGHPFLFVGSIGASLNHDSLRKNGITQVINLSSSADDYMSAANDHVMQRRLLEDKDQTLLSFLSESSFARKEITDLIIHRYTATRPSEIESDGLDNAVEAIELLESDGEPIQISGRPFLFVGSVGSSLNREALRRSGITHVINWSTSAKCNEFADIEYMCFTGIRGSDIQGHLAELDKAVELVESVRKAGGRVLSHCWYGKNRSVTLLVAYLMKYEEMSATQANDLIKMTRPQAAPYFDTLKAYSERYISGNTENFTKIKETKAKTTLNNDANN